MAVQGARGVVVASSAEESVYTLSLGPRESGVVSVGRSAVSPELVEVGVCAVFPRGRRSRWTCAEGIDGSKTATMQGSMALG